MTRIVVLWLHLLAAAVWLGGLLHTSHLVVPALARGEQACLPLLARARSAAWGALALLVVTGLDNLRRVRLDSSWLAAKLVVVFLLLSLAAHRDFALLPRTTRAMKAGIAPASALRGLRRLDRVLVLLAVVAFFLGVGLARGR